MIAGPIRYGVGLAALLAIGMTTDASATRLPIQGIVISKEATQNITCSVNVCMATAASAILNVTVLRQMLKHSDVTVSTGSAAQDIDIAAALTWASSHTLTLDAQHSIEIDRPVTVTGDGGLTLTIDDGGTDGALAFGSGGNVNFWSLSSALTINGGAYTLVDDIATLASDIAAHPHRNYALAKSITLSGFYPSAPIPGAFGGTFEGLGNTISGFSIFDLSGTADALFAFLSHDGILRDIGLLDVSIKNSNSSGFGRSAPLVAQSEGTIVNAFATGTAGCDDRFFSCISGGLVAVNYGSVSYSWAAVNIEAGEESQDGGLIGNNHGDITDCFATGSVASFQSANEGGLIGYNIGRAAITNTYATGAVSGDGADVGGLIGYSFESSKISSSYASGALSGTSLGGLINYDVKKGHLSATYWDTTTSGVSNPSQGAGFPANDPGVTGLSDAQLKSALPAGFDSSVWARKHTINGGLPYLIAAPPS